MKYLFITLLSSMLALMACSKNEEKKQTEKPLILVSVSPYDTFVKKIAGDTVDVKTAVPSNYNSHVFETTPKQIEKFDQAKIWIGIQEPFEKNLLKSLKTYSKDIITLDLSKNLPLADYDQKSLTHQNCSHHHDHDHHHHHEDELDRHFWTSPRLSRLQSEMIKQTLVQTFPEHKTLYEKNFKQLEKEFEDLDANLKSTLKKVKGCAIILSHPSLGYFCKDYDLVQLSIECEGKTALPEDLQKVLSLSKQHEVLCIFTQEQFDNKGAIAVAKHLNLPVYTINPNKEDYFKNMQEIADLIAKNKP